MKNLSRLMSKSALVALVALGLSACTDDDDVIVGNITISESELNKTVEWDEVESSITFTANSSWTASVSDVTTRAANTKIEWLTLTVNSGNAGEVKMPFCLKKNDSEFYRDAQIEIRCGDKTSVINVHQNQNPDAVHTMDRSQVENFDKYICPGTWNEGFERGVDHMLRDDAKWSFWRMKQSEHFFVFWEPGFGYDPNGSDVPAALRVNIDDLLQKAEQFYTTNVEKLKMVTVGQGKSNLDKYKMQIYLLYQEDWLATGSGYDNQIGALWVNPSTCQPAGSTIAHEIGHSFQYQAGCDKLLNGQAEETAYGMNGGFRYGFGANGAGGCAYWEQCAQWQSFQDYPEECFTQNANVSVWLRSHHRHFNHEFMRYASYWLPYYLTQKHGIEAYGRIWQESTFPEDPIQTYARLFCASDMEKFYDEYYDYAARCVNYDFDAVHQYLGQNSNATNYTTHMLPKDGGFQPTYDNCPGTTGFNAIELNTPAAGTVVKADLKAVTPGSALVSGDAGKVVDGDGHAISTVTTYNQQTNTSSAYRIGFVAVSGGKTTYGTMAKGKNAVAEMKVPAGTDKLYLVVVATPTDYQRQGWDDDETNDQQWPYNVKFENTGVKGFVEIPAGNPEDVALTFDLNGLDAAYEGYQVAEIDLLGEGLIEQMAKAFRLQPTEILGAMAQRADDKVVPEEGKVAVGLTQPDGTISFACSTNAIGPWINAEGMAATWGEGQLYYEYSGTSYLFPVGFKPGTVEAGKTYTMKPTFVYTKDGKEYKAVITLNLHF
ncbi:protein of unknown function [Prevotella aff. ruminicola Tc2-24]|uniref:Uncharacterized protein n=1 Tax=Prevotella aff. ruminicola Tc2-24 TaxID=81582 RepID=A0A1I0QEL3_9BACT|nr:DUF6055 domain-containing protein [Prevotella aff. ruminicola Tc2-24]SEW25334.1 protein of unknown function [Prevotella aff. ruminicola Tc2-24]